MSHGLGLMLLLLELLVAKLLRRCQQFWPPLHVRVLIINNNKIMPKLHSIKILKLYYMIVHIMGLHVGHSRSPSIWLTFFGVVLLVSWPSKLDTNIMAHSAFKTTDCNFCVAVYKSPVYEKKAFDLVCERLASIGYPQVSYYCLMFTVEYSACYRIMHVQCTACTMSNWAGS